MGLRNDLGLLSEEYDPVAGRLVGQLPAGVLPRVPGQLGLEAGRARQADGRTRPAGPGPPGRLPGSGPHRHGWVRAPGRWIQRQPVRPRRRGSPIAESDGERRRGRSKAAVSGRRGPGHAEGPSARNRRQLAVKRPSARGRPRRRAAGGRPVGRQGPRRDRQEGDAEEGRARRRRTGDEHRREEGSATKARQEGGDQDGDRRTATKAAGQGGRPARRPPASVGKKTAGQKAAGATRRAGVGATGS